MVDFQMLQNFEWSWVKFEYTYEHIVTIEGPSIVTRHLSVEK